MLHPLSPTAFLCATLLSGPAFALSLQIERPDATEIGGVTELSATVEGESGTVEIRWDFGDGAQLDFAAGQLNATHEYVAPGHYPVIVVARDDSGFSSTSFVHTVHRPLSDGRPTAASSIVFSPEFGVVCNVNPDNDTVSLIDTDTLEKVAEIPVYDQPETLAIGPNGQLWVLHRDDYAIAILDLEHRRIVANLRLPYASQPMGIAASPTGDAMYVTLMGTGKLVVIDPDEKEIVGSIDVGPFARGIAVSHDGKTILVTRFISPEGQGEVTVVDANTREITSVIALPEDTTSEDTDQQGRGLPNYLFSVAISPDGGEAWVPGKKDNMARGILKDGLALTQDNTLRPLLSILDLSSGMENLDRRIDLDDRNLPAHVEFSPLGDYAFVSVVGSGLVEVRDVFSGELSTALGNTGFAPRGSVLDDRGRLFVHAGLSRTVAIYDVSKVISGDDNLTNRLADVLVVENEALPEAVLRGKQVFYDSEDKRMTQEGYISCASCHFEGFEDGRIWEFSDRGEGFRNTTSLLGRSGTGHGNVHWTGNFDEIQDFEGAIRTGFAGAGFIPDDLYEQGTVSDPLGDSKAGLSEDLDALASYVTSLASVPPSPFKNDDGTLTEEAERGRELFLDLGCDSCHSGDQFTDSGQGVLYDVGTLKESSGSRLGETLAGIDTPTLLGIWQTAPYLHDGSAPTLRDVLSTQNPDDLHGETSTLSVDQVDDLVAYLQQLDGGQTPTELPPVEPLSETDERKTSSRERGGCSVNVAPSAAPFAWLLFALGLLALARRLSVPSIR